MTEHEQIIQHMELITDWLKINGFLLAICASGITWRIICYARNSITP